VNFSVSGGEVVPTSHQASRWDLRTKTLHAAHDALFLSSVLAVSKRKIASET